MNLKQVFILGWPVLSVLLLCSIISLTTVLQCWLALRYARRTSARREALAELEYVERRLAILGTIANATPFIGLLGTVIGIIRAFHSISVSGGGGLGTVAGGISEALISTAAGLAVAIPASMFFNYFTYGSQAAAKRLEAEEPVTS
jgi:biopolymer transport protein ExbB